MIRIYFNEPISVTWKRWRKDCERETAILCEEVEKGNKPNIKNLYKRRSIKTSIYMSIDGPFHGKCAYCEALMAADQSGDIEHFRPAKAVTDEDGTPITYKDKTGEVLPHPGYYWLAYDWNNLLPSCDKCNRPNSIDGTLSGKFTKFPLIRGQYATSPQNENNEEPLLINPMFEDPENHLEVDFETAVLSGDERAMGCINIFGLNIRPGILTNRLMAYKAASYDLIKFRDSTNEAEERKYLTNLCDIVAGKTPYSFIARSIIKSTYPDLFEDLRQMVFAGD